jgi:hypothetical protein
MTEYTDDRIGADQFSLRFRQLSINMAGFSGLLLVVQGALTGYSLATGEVWITGDVETTRTIAHHVMSETASMTEAYGVEQ